MQWERWKQNETFHDNVLYILNLSTPEISLIILSSNYFIFPCKLPFDSYENFVLDQDKNFSISLSILLTWIMHKYEREKFHVDHFRESKS